MDKPLSYRVEIPAELVVVGLPPFVDIRVVWRKPFLGLARTVLGSPIEQYAEWPTTVCAMMATVFTNEPWNAQEELECLLEDRAELRSWMLEQARAGLRKVEIEPELQSLNLARE